MYCISVTNKEHTYICRILLSKPLRGTCLSLCPRTRYSDISTWRTWVDVLVWTGLFFTLSWLLNYILRVQGMALQLAVLALATLATFSEVQPLKLCRYSLTYANQCRSPTRIPWPLLEMICPYLFAAILLLSLLYVGRQFVYCTFPTDRMVLLS